MKIIASDPAQKSISAVPCGIRRSSTPRTACGFPTPSRPSSTPTRCGRAGWRSCAPGCARPATARVVLFDPYNQRYATGSRNMFGYFLRNSTRYFFIPAEGPDRPVRIPAELPRLDGARHGRRGAALQAGLVRGVGPRRRDRRPVRRRDRRSPARRMAAARRSSGSTAAATCRRWRWRSAAARSGIARARSWPCAR